jgi:hypothetical protein
VEFTLFEVVFIKAAEERIGVVEKRNLLHNGLIVILILLLNQIWNRLEYQRSRYVAAKHRILSDKATKIAKHEEWTDEHD